MSTTSPTPTLANGAQALRPGTHQSVAYTAAAGTIANAVRASVLRIVLTQAGYILISAAGTSATTSDVYVAADQPEYFRCEPGDKVSAVRVTNSGSLHVTEMD